MEEFELTPVYKYHAFCCFQQRPQGHPRGCCTSKGGQMLWERLSTKVQNEGMMEIGVTGTGCLGFCMAGPLMVVYPQGIWYRPTTPEDIDEIIESHFKNDKPVERLIMVLSQ